MNNNTFDIIDLNTAVIKDLATKRRLTADQDYTNYFLLLTGTDDQATIPDFTFTQMIREVVRTQHNTDHTGHTHQFFNTVLAANLDTIPVIDDKPVTIAQFVNHIITDALNYLHSLAYNL